MPVELFFIFAAVWLLGAVGVAEAARKRRRSFLGWLLLSLFISPVLSFAILLISTGTELVSNQPPEPEKKCPKCAETVKAGAEKCRFCGHDFVPAALRAYREKRRPTP